MWLIEITINGNLHRISTDAAALEHYWHDYVAAFDPISYSISELTGGYIKPAVGSMELSPELFENDYPPPLSCPVAVKYTDSDESSAVTIWSGNAHRAGIGRGSVVYNFQGSAYPDTIVATAISDTLANVFTTYCGATHLNLTLNTSAARAVSPLVDRAASDNESLTIEVLSSLAAAVNHFFYIAGTTLYLCDMLADNGESTQTEFDFAPVEYEDQPPYSLFSSDIYSISGSYAYGEKYDFNIHESVASESRILSHLSGAKSILEAPIIRLERGMLAANIPTFGEKISFVDESTGPTPINAWLRVRNLRFSEDGEFMTIEGEGEIA